MSRVHRVACLTTGRQDYGILRSTCLLLARDPRFELLLIAGGMHLDPAFGRTVQRLVDDGLTVRAAIEPLGADETAGRHGPSQQAAAMMARLSPVLQDLDPDALILAGDRSETAAAALVAVLHRVPLVHLHGGEETEGAVDNVLRHAITKMSHLHLVSHPLHRSRVLQMGEEPGSVHVVGAPGLDNLHRDDLDGPVELEKFLGLPLRPPVVIVTFHPTTLGGSPEAEARAVLQALRSVEATYVITLPNNDSGAEGIRGAFLEFAAATPGAVAVEALGERRYFGLMRHADAVLGNSSSALIEAPLYRLPVVNVGDRQKGRLRGDNVIDVGVDAGEIAAGLRRALDPSFRASLGAAGPYGDGRSAPRIVELLAAWEPPRPPRKRFHDTAAGGAAGAAPWVH
jgi:UDP-hydrolysing UDP-N-acetyl-D-glucosamine 2-epimerase